MFSLRRPRVSVEQLEQRDCPSLTAMLNSGLLSVSGTPTGAALFTQTANNQWQVKDGSRSLGTYNASNVSLRVTNHQNIPITFDLNGHTDGGNISVDLGTGDTSGLPRNALALVSGTQVAPSAGTLGGNFSVTNGSGEESVFLGFTNVSGTVFSSSSVTVGGNVSFNGRSNANLSGGNLIDTGNNLSVNDPVTPTVRIGGSVTTSAAGAEIAKGTTVGLDVTLNAAGASFQSGGASDAQIYGNVGRNVNITGSMQSKGDIVFIGGLAPMQIGGNLTISTPGSQANVIEISNVGPGTTTIAGSTLIQTGGGTNYLTMDGVFNGDLTMQLGGGVNTDTTAIPFTSGATPLGLFPADAVVGGNFRLTAGDGANNLTTPGNPFAGQVNGYTSITLGNGANAEFTVSSGNLAGKFIWRSGNGNDSLTFRGAPAGTVYNVDVQFGNGDDVFTFDDAGSYLTGRVDGGGSITGNQFNFMNGTILQPFTESNF